MFLLKDKIKELGKAYNLSEEQVMEIYKSSTRFTASIVAEGKRDDNNYWTIDSFKNIHLSGLGKLAVIEKRIKQSNRKIKEKKEKDNA